MDKDMIAAAVQHEAFSTLSAPWWRGGKWDCRFQPVTIGDVQVSITGQGLTAASACEAALNAWNRASGEAKAAGKALRA